jgi:hypothetical protein
MLGLNRLLKRKKDDQPVAKTVVLAVLCATAREGLSAKDALALRDIIVGATPVYVQFLNPGGFIVCFNGSALGKTKADELAEMLKQYAKDNAIIPFGVATHVGECNAVVGADEQIVAIPLGLPVNHAMQAAYKVAR